MNLKQFTSIVVLVAAAMGSAFAANTGVVHVSDNTYSVLREAKNTFNRDTQVLKDAAMQEAENFCKQQGKELKVVTWMVYKPRFISGYASAKLVFKAFAPGDPELTATPAALPTTPILTSGAPGDLYTELLKLDDLKKRGILSEKEFEAEKKKALKRGQ
jgi:hypothetical protein